MAHHTPAELFHAQTHVGRIARWYFAEHPKAGEARFRADFLECLSEIEGRLADDIASAEHEKE